MSTRAIAVGLSVWGVACSGRVEDGGTAAAGSASSAVESARPVESAGVNVVPSKVGDEASRLVRELATASAGDAVSFIYTRTTDGGVADTLRVDGRAGGARLTYIKQRPGTPVQIFRMDHTGALGALEPVAASGVFAKTHDEEQRPTSFPLSFLFFASDGTARFEKRLFKTLPEPIGATTPGLEAVMKRVETEGKLAGSEPRKKGIGKGPPIGDATMKPDGTIVLDLRPELPSGGGHGLARLEYPKGHPEYADVLEHLGGLQPGENKLVPPWPE